MSSSSRQSRGRSTPQQVAPPQPMQVHVLQNGQLKRVVESSELDCSRQRRNERRDQSVEVAEKIAATISEVNTVGAEMAQMKVVHLQLQRRSQALQASRDDLDEARKTDEAVQDELATLEAQQIELSREDTEAKELTERLRKEIAEKREETQQLRQRTSQAEVQIKKMRDDLSLEAECKPIVAEIQQIQTAISKLKKDKLTAEGAIAADLEFINGMKEFNCDVCKKKLTSGKDKLIAESKVLTGL